MDGWMEGYDECNRVLIDYVAFYFRVCVFHWIEICLSWARIEMRGGGGGRGGAMGNISVRTSDNGWLFVFEPVKKIKVACFEGGGAF